jgi:hypothetical protein
MLGLRTQTTSPRIFVTTHRQTRLQAPPRLGLFLGLDHAGARVFDTYASVLETRWRYENPRSKLGIGGLCRIRRPMLYPIELHPQTSRTVASGGISVHCGGAGRHHNRFTVNAGVVSTNHQLHLQPLGVIVRGRCPFRSQVSPGRGGQAGAVASFSTAGLLPGLRPAARRTCREDEGAGGRHWERLLPSAAKIAGFGLHFRCGPR